MKASAPTSSSGFFLAIATLIAIIATLVVNTVSNFLPPGGLNVGQIANTLLREVRIIPANYAFAIWGIIYLGLIAYGIYQLGPSQRNDPTIRRVNLLLIVACVAQIAWVYLFTLRMFGISIIAIVAILLALIGAYLQLKPGEGRVSRSRKWWAQIPFSTYTAWISVATIVNIASALYAAGWQGGGISPDAWTVIMIAVSAVIAAIAAVQRTDIAFTLVFVWAYLAIAIRQSDSSVIVTGALAASLILLALLALSHHKSRVRSS